MRRLEELRPWRVFCQVVQSGGLNAACEALQMEPSVASRLLRELERELGVELFAKGSRPLKLTAPGREAEKRIRAWLAQYDAFLTDLRGEDNRLEGLIRIGAAEGTAAAILAPLIVRFQKLHPKIFFDLDEISSPPPQAFLREDGAENDLVAGYGAPDPIEGFVSIHTGVIPFVACVSPTYVARFGAPATVEECAGHTGLQLRTRLRSRTALVENGSERKTVRWKTVLSFKSHTALKQAALLGAGIVPDLPLAYCAQELKSGDLIPVLPGWQRPSLAGFVYVTQNAWMKQRVHLFTQWLVEQIRNRMHEMERDFPQYYENHPARRE